MNETPGGVRRILQLIAYTFIISFISLNWSRLTGHDEPRVAGIARWMAISGDYTVPRLNGRPFCEYPPLGYIPIAIFIKIFGADEFWANAPNILYFIGTVFLIYRIGRGLADERSGLAAGYLLATMAGAIGIFKLCLVDGALLFYITLSLFGYAESRAGARVRRNIAIFALGMSLAFLTKGIIGIALPAAVAFVDSTARRDWKILQIKNLLFGILIFGAPIGIWSAVLIFGGNSDVGIEVLRQSVWRFSSSTADHSNPFYYYLGPVVYLTAPASLVIFACLARWFMLSENRFNRRLTFPAIWFIVIFLALSAASAKRFIYLAPIYPSVALAAGILMSPVRPGGEGRRAVAINLALLIVIIIVWTQSSEAASYASIIERTRKEGGNNSNILLYHPTEGLEGAAVFYLGGETARVKTPEELTKIDLNNYKFILAELRRNENNPLKSLELPGGAPVEAARDQERQETMILYKLP